ncbi:MAG: DNA-binding response regulator [Actinobacteria bacterium]|nr:DNA-binding response regulator [Actinomycetota bacterium]
MTRQPRARILIVDDEENISFLLSAAWRGMGYAVDVAETGQEAITLAGTRQPDIVVLDVSLPDFDGFEVLRRLRLAGNKVPVIFLTARGDTDDRIRGLIEGADDYLAKPFSLEELSARVVACLRRAGITTVDSRHTVADLVVDDDAHRVWRGHEEVHLTATEYKLLHCLIVNVGRVVSRTQILEHVWQYDFDGDSSIVESFVSNLRKKVDRSEPKLIHTVRGVGYSLRVG